MKVRLYDFKGNLVEEHDLLAGNHLKIADDHLSSTVKACNAKIFDDNGLVLQTKDFGDKKWFPVIALT